MAEKIEVVKHNKKQNKVALLGAVLLTFAIIGLITLVVVAINFGTGLFSNEGQKDMFEDLVAPLVMVDPAPFDSADLAGDGILVRSAINKTIIEENTDKYADKVRLGYLTIPTTDIEKYGAQLYGPDISLEFETFGDYVNMYEYDSDLGAYHVPTAGQLTYTPSVENISYLENDIAEVTVGYISRTWLGDVEGNKYEPEPEKYMIYITQKLDDSYHIIGIRDLTNDERIALGLATEGHGIFPESSENSNSDSNVTDNSSTPDSSSTPQDSEPESSSDTSTSNRDETSDAE